MLAPVVARVPGAQLVVAGLGNDVPRLQAKARALGVPRVVFCGFLPRDALTVLWSRIAVFAMPSAREGFGLVYLEAMRAGRPCIGSTSDAAGDIIVHGETGCWWTGRMVRIGGGICDVADATARGGGRWERRAVEGFWRISRPIGLRLVSAIP